MFLSRNDINAKKYLKVMSLLDVLGLTIFLILYDDSIANSFLYIVLTFVLDYLTSVDSVSVQEHRERIDSLLGQDSNWEKPMVWRDPIKSAELLSDSTTLRIETEELISEMYVRRPELVAMGNESRYFEAMQYASVARQLLNFYAA